MSDILVVQIAGQPETPVPSLEAASKHYRKFLVDGGIGSREAPFCHVVRGDRKIGHISYNGRIWKLGLPGKSACPGPLAGCIYDPFKQEE